MLQAYEQADKKGWGVALRVPILYGEGRNEESAVNVLMDAVMGQKEGKMTKIDHWALRYPTNTEDVARVLQGNYVYLSCVRELVVATQVYHMVVYTQAANRVNFKA